MMRKEVAVGIVLVLVGACLIPSASSELSTGDRLPFGTTIITVDDEPGDADYSSIKEAVNASSPGDTIEVYSGIYREEGILIAKDNISLLGISHELGGGNDTEKPFIKPDGTKTAIRVLASHVIVSNFRVEMLSSSFCIELGNGESNLQQNNNTVSDCIIRNPYGYGIRFYRVGRDISIINNTISNCDTVGLTASSLSFTVTGNVITDCEIVGISILLCSYENISYNTIKRCRAGIRIDQASNTIIFGNELEACTTPILNKHGGSNRIIHNNFREYRYFEPWFVIPLFQFWDVDRWNANYWDTWRGTGSKIIPGLSGFGIPFPGGEFVIPIPLPWFSFDRHPAQEPYDFRGKYQ